MKKARRVATLRLEDGLYVLLCTQNNLGVLLHADILKMEDRKVMNAANGLLYACEQLLLKFSKGLDWTFQKTLESALLHCSR